MINQTLPTTNINDLEQLKFRTDLKGNVVARTFSGSGQIAKNSASAFISKMIQSYSVDNIVSESIGDEEIITLYNLGLPVARITATDSDINTNFTLKISTVFSLATQDGGALVSQSGDIIVTQ